ncbi:MAG TPA: hypothetical protein PLO33_15125 [Kouleothrix sp.]|uniref:hypothetical protein n=1 Tax=Kouleothrix sp. TaxID=2779161 RepID=UPI002C1941B0|nr:hypothetical protein [Kouleothrix sp.]HRC77010.1 hypothetical protein [Kouleothrix sp.]
MNNEQRTLILQRLAAALARRRLVAPARIALDVIAPLGFLAGQAAQFVHPLVPAGRWHDYVAALSDEQGWSTLQSLVEQCDC